ncbi:hypothetical protein Esi_0174_0018 [Ectocarpus siliculosus]|uniref:Uncharacterized protein n=1 Tax=Ectocarpus siliculosus TaxID=2880 RepID=D8LGL8_ECTSI|nr:hypothetical protein Esi_0174_0018 [Ectocarpus siliculosus]|eukprot:CBN75760.1 hypothetical protein Esi_0174_0018 [Ectocarpus siliculosus]
MTSISKQNDLQGRLQVSLAAEGGQQTCSATEQSLAEFEDVPAIAATITPREDAHGKRQTATGSKRPKSSEHCVGGDPGSISQRGGLESGSIGGPYGWSPSSCDRHLRRRRRSRSRSRANITTNAPKALVDGEMEVALAGGSRLAMKAMRAVQQANTQVCYANLETARKDIALGVERQKYKRLEADMYRSRVELADTLCDVETDREKHDSEMAQAEKRAKELEVALRAADEVLRQLTAETKQKRYDAEDRETSLRARLVALERRAEASERDCRNQKLSTWRTITRETERAAARERYRLAAFLQRYVVENEFLRASKAKAEESASDLRETLRQTEGKLVKALAAAPAPLRGPETLMSNARKATWAMGMANGGVQGQGGGAGAGGAGRGRAYGGPQARGCGGTGVGTPEGQAAAARDPPAQPTAVAAVSQAEMAIRRMKGQAGAAREKHSDFSSGGGRGDNDSELGSWSGSNWGRGGKSAQRAATASVRGELRYTRGLVAELSFLLSATESERDSLASLVVLAEQRMERLVFSQEELALKLAWGNVSSMEEQHRYEQRRFKQQQQQQYLQIDGEGGSYAGTVEDISAATGQQPRQIEASATLASEEGGGGGNDVHRSTDGRHEPATNPEGAPITAATFEKSREALDKLELGRRVRELEVLLEATEAGAREIEQENRRLQSLHGGFPRPWQSWSGGEGVVSSTAGDDPCRRHYSETSRSNVTTSGSGRDGSRRLDGGDESGREAAATSRTDARSGQSSRGHGGNGQNSVSLPMLSAAEVGRGGGESTGTRAGSEATVVAQTAEGAGVSFSETTGWDWTQESGATSRPEGRCRPRSSPFAPQRRGDRSWEKPGSGSGGGCGDGTEGGGEISNGDEAAFLIKGQLAWVLGLPAETTETHLLAEVMHLVVERGSANTDAGVLEVQLGKMDEQSLSLTRLAAATITSHVGGGGLNRGHAVLAGGGSGGGRRRGEGHRGSNGGGLNLADIGSGYSSNASFLSSLSHADGGGGGGGGGDAGGARGGRRATHLPTAGQQHADGANNATNDDINHAVAAPTAAAAAPPRPRRTAPDRGGRTGNDVDASASQQGPAGRDGVGGSGAERRDSSKCVAPAAPSAGAATVGAGKPVAPSSTADGSGGVSSSEPLDENTVRTTFSKTIQGRVVSIDVFCSKVMSEAERKQEEARADARETGVKMDDVDYEIRVEAYDPAVLKHHVLHIQDEHIKGCLRAHPHLYTLGPSSVASGGSSGGGGGVRGGAPSGPGTKPGEEPNLLLVLIGDAGELVTAEKRPEENADSTEGGAAVAPDKRVHRHAKSAIMQIAKEEKVLEGVVYQYEPPLKEEVDPEQAEIAARLLAVESEASSQSTPFWDFILGLMTIAHLAVYAKDVPPGERGLWEYSAILANAVLIAALC